MQIARDRAAITALHSRIADVVKTRNGPATAAGLTALEEETQALAATVFTARHKP